MGWLQDWKQGKAKHVAEYHAFRDYAQQAGFCWACGRSSQYRDKPASYGAFWMIQRAHIVSNPRLEDRRVVCLLCPLCHAAYDDKGDDSITLANMLYLKQLFDPKFFDIDLLQKCSIRRLPAGTDLNSPRIAEFQQRRGLTRKAIDA